MTAVIETKQARNQELLERRTALFNDRPGPRVGDYLKLPYGLYTRFTHNWDDSLQTGGGSESFYLGEGYISYSGSLDTGVKTSHIRQTSERKTGRVWFFDSDHARAGGGVSFDIEFRVFELLSNADTSGLPDIKRYEKRELLKQAETITRINGNGQPYTLPVPEVHIFKQHIKPEEDEQLKAISVLSFEDWVDSYRIQPKTVKQYEEIKAITARLNQSYYNNASSPNRLYIGGR